MVTTIELQDSINQLEKRYNDILANGEAETRMLNEGEALELGKIKLEIEEKRSQLEALKLDLEKRSNNKLNSDNMEKFSLLQSINAIANGQQLNERSLEVINAGKEEMRKSGMSFQGQIQIPVCEARSLNIATEGADVVTEDKLSILPALRERSVLGSLGATFLTGLSGDVSIPKYSGSSVTWEGETVAAKDGEGTIDSVKYSPKRLTAKIDISKQFLIQDSVGAEAMLRSDLVNAIMEKLEATLLGSAAGSATQPAGLFNLVAPTASVKTYAGVVGLESALEANKVMGEIKFALSPAAKATMKTTQAFTGAGAGILNGSEMDGLKYESTGNIPANHFALGKWSDYVVCQFGAMDITVDPYSQAANGVVRLVVNAYFDAKPRRAESFVTAKTIA